MGARALRTVVFCWCTGGWLSFIASSRLLHKSMLAGMYGGAVLCTQNAQNATQWIFRRLLDLMPANTRDMQSIRPRFFHLSAVWRGRRYTHPETPETHTYIHAHTTAHAHAIHTARVYTRVCRCPQCFTLGRAHRAKKMRKAVPVHMARRSDLTLSPTRPSTSRGTQGCMAFILSMPLFHC
jgi:hypothetical protein